MKPLLFSLLGLSLGAWAQNALWDFQNLAWDYGMWFTFVPAVPAMIAITLILRRRA